MKHIFERVYVYIFFLLFVVFNTSRAVYENAFGLGRELSNIIFILLNGAIILYAAIKNKKFRQYFVLLTVILYFTVIVELIFLPRLNFKSISTGIIIYLLVYSGAAIRTLLQSNEVRESYQTVMIGWAIFMVVAAVMEIVGNQFQFMVKENYEGLMRAEFGMFRASVGFWTQISAGLYFFSMLIFCNFLHATRGGRVYIWIAILMFIGILCTLSRLYIYFSFAVLIINFINKISYKVALKVFIIFVSLMLFLTSTLELIGFSVDDILSIILSQDEGSKASNDDKYNLWIYIYNYMFENAQNFLLGKGVGGEITLPWEQKIIGDGAILTMIIEMGFVFSLIYLVVSFYPVISRRNIFWNEDPTICNLRLFYSFALIISMVINSSMLDLPVSILATYIIVAMQWNKYDSKSAA